MKTQQNLQAMVNQSGSKVWNEFIRWVEFREAYSYRYATFVAWLSFNSSLHYLLAGNSVENAAEAIWTADKSDWQ